MRGRAARIGQIHLHHPPVAAVQQPLGIGLQSQNGLEGRCQHQRCRRLHDSIARARYACRSVAPGLVLEYQHLSHRLRAYAPVCKSLASLGHPFPLLRFLSNRDYPASSILRAPQPPCMSKLALRIPSGHMHATDRASRVATTLLMYACRHPYPQRRRPSLHSTPNRLGFPVAGNFPPITAGRRHAHQGLLGIHSRCALRPW